jgi:hypothetical protein
VRAVWREKYTAERHATLAGRGNRIIGEIIEWMWHDGCGGQAGLVSSSPASPAPAGPVRRIISTGLPKMSTGLPKMTGREIAVRILDIMVAVAMISLSLILGFGLKYPWWTTGGLVVALAGPEPTVEVTPSAIGWRPSATSYGGLVRRLDGREYVGELDAAAAMMA